MSLAALAMVLAAAFIHAGWNLLAKRAGGGAVFVWIYSTAACVLYAPITLPVLLLHWHEYGALHWTFMIGSGLIHLVYFLLLQRAYRTGDLSLIYPLARGTGPLIATATAIPLLGERPSALAIAGAALICVSIFVFAKPTRHTPSPALGFGLSIGALIAIYTVWDKYAVSTLGVSPLAMEWVTATVRTTLLAPFALRAREELSREWTQKKKFALWIGALNPLAYWLVLFAMQFTPLSYVAPAREVSIVIGAFLGARYLGEGDRNRRLTAAFVMAAGVVALAIG